MNELAIRDQLLPDRIEDIAKFLLIAPEKATALRAEIRAIQNLQLAQEVYDQKMEEQRRLQELILDASVRVGEFTKALPKAPPGRKSEMGNTTDTYFKSKEEVIQDMGFSKMQAHRFETLANNTDLVEQVKAEARENGTAPTRTKVLDLAQARKEKRQQQDNQVDADYAALSRFHKFVSYADLHLIDETMLCAVARTAPDFPSIIHDLDNLIQMLTIIKGKLLTERGKLDG